MPVETVVRHRWNDIPAESINRFITRRYITAGRVTVARFELARGGVVPRHSHEQEQITCILSGRLKFVIDGPGAHEVEAGPGEVVQIPGWVEHEVHVVEDAEVLDVFSPIRQDWIDRTDDYFRRE